MDTIVFLLALPGAWIVLQFVSSFSYACENFLDEWLLHRHRGEEEESVGSLLLISGFFGIVAATIFGLVAYFAPNPEVTIFVGTELTLRALGAGLLEVLYLIPYLYAVNRVGAVKTAPLFQVIPVISLILGLFVFGEIPPIVHIIGAGIIIIGGLALNLSEVEGNWKVDSKTIALMLFSSTIVVISSFIFKDAALEGNFVAAAFWGGIGMTTMSTVIFLVYAPYRKQFLTFVKRADKPAWLYQLANETVDTIALTTSQVALVLGPSVMAVYAMNAWQPVFILLIGWVLAKRGSQAHAELLHNTKLKQIACAIALLAAGTVLIAL